ncbi:malate/quinone oxidoreductase [Segniliparus rotundus DSM 44985]|uniref:Probable malate:quinone oxidoreductase n=1 Tax=Segniliparus rotundus (strain ATCC BAA-972 / CDC 1076 / CIP 108378 / DSM 44985 / JCM 13578) TaxID=640132 RepID=D6Z8P4_SEGRD|nr:malate dehydrogenase (quinone) [Segniliparus rotundus]ADG98324.1 malate/quinone oxidoreductase [Segniliparus rotundus DSM 44985]
MPEHTAPALSTKKTGSAILETDVALIGAGIVSATLGSLLRQVQPDWSIAVFERLPGAAQESSSPWNNAGTGHSALCELNYTPLQPDGSVDITKAVAINEQFQVSRQFWSSLVQAGHLSEPKQFINPISHMSWVTGQEDADYLKARHEALVRHPLFSNMGFSTDPGEFAKRLPLMARGRDFSEPFAITWEDDGTDVNFGELTRQLLAHVAGAGPLLFEHEVTSLKRDGERWKLSVKNLRTGEKTTARAKFVFVGAGGYALPLLQSAGVPSVKGMGGFPISGAFLRCTNPDIVAQHQAKVYAKAKGSAPPMSVPHLDTRVIDGKRSILFGPYAGWSPKYLKEGRLTDLVASLRPMNILPYLSVGLTEFGLVKYLVSQLLQSSSDRIAALQDFVPSAEASDWDLYFAGQRVQIIRGKGAKGALEFGTAVEATPDGTVAGLLGASPGASVCASAMLSLLERCFPKDHERWSGKLKELVPSYGTKLSDNPQLHQRLFEESAKALELTPAS